MKREQAEAWSEAKSQARKGSVVCLVFHSSLVELCIRLYTLGVKQNSCILQDEFF